MRFIDLGKIFILPTRILTPALRAGENLELVFDKFSDLNVARPTATANEYGLSYGERNRHGKYGQDGSEICIWGADGGRAIAWHLNRSKTIIVLMTWIDYILYPSLYIETRSQYKTILTANRILELTPPNHDRFAQSLTQLPASSLATD
jgi:hypothetical protein